MAEKVSKEHDIAREQHSEAESQSSDEAWRSKSRPKQVCQYLQDLRFRNNTVDASTSSHMNRMCVVM